MYDLLLVFLGWMLGVFSPIVTGWFTTRSERKSYMASALGELKDIQYRLMWVVHRVKLQHGQVDKDTLEWQARVIEGYDGPEKLAGEDEIARQMRSHDPVEVNKVAAVMLDSTRSLNFTHVSVGILDNRSPALSFCPLDFQLRLNAVRTHVGYYNDQVDFLRAIFEKTFDNSISAENREVMEQNRIATEQKLANRARIIVDKVWEIRSRYEIRPTPSQSQKG